MALPRVEPIKLPIAQMFLRAAEEGYNYDIPVYPTTGWGLPNRATPNARAIINKNTNWQWVATDKICKTISEVGKGIYKDGQKGQNLIKGGEWYERLEYPSPDVPWHEFIYDMMANFLTLGTAFNYKVLNPFNQPLWIYNMYEEFGSIRVDKDVYGRVVKYVLTGPNGRKDIPPEQMSHFRYFNISDSTYGRGPAMAMPHMVDLDEQIKRFASTTFRLGGVKQGFLTQPANVQDLSDKQYQRLENDLDESVDANSGGWRGVGILPPGMEYIDAKISPHDLQSAEMFSIVRDQLAQTFGIPKSVMGISEATNRADAEAGIYVYYKFCIAPYLKWIESYLNRVWIKKIDPTVSLKFDNVVPEDMELKARVYRELLESGQRTIDELRAQDDLAPYEKGLGSKPLVSSSLATLESVVEDLNINFNPIDGTDKKIKDNKSIEGDVDAVDTAIQDLGLNGAQIKEFKQIVIDVINGLMPPEAGKEMIKIAFPKLSEDAIDKVFQKIKGFKPKPIDGNN